MPPTRKGSKKSDVDMGRLMRRIVADNVIRHMDERFAAIPTQTGRWKALAMKANTSASTVERIVKHQIGASIDTVEDLARALKVPAPSLFVASDELREALGVRSPDAEDPPKKRRRTVLT